MIVSTLVGLPVALWFLYAHQVVGPDRVGMGNFAYPFFGFYEKIRSEWAEALFRFPKLPLLEMLAPLSIAVQVIWLVRNARPSSEWWRWGAAYTVLALMIGGYVWASQSAYGRCLLPMTVCFNILLFQAGLSKPRNRVWWIVGNIGLLDRAAPGLMVMGLARLGVYFAKGRAPRKLS